MSYLDTIETGSIFTIKNLIIYFIVINILAFLAMLIDKRKAEKGKWRPKESTLLALALIGGSIGALIGMYTFHHKTQKARFFVGIPLMLFLHIMIIIAFIF